MKCKLKLCVPFHRKKHTTVSIPHIDTITHTSSTANTNICHTPSNARSKKEDNDSAESLSIGQEMRKEILSLLEDSMTSLAPHGSDEDLYIYVSASMNSLNNDCQQQQQEQHKQQDGDSTSGASGRFQDGIIKDGSHEIQDGRHEIQDDRHEIKDDKYKIQEGGKIANKSLLTPNDGTKTRNSEEKNNE